MHKKHIGCNKVKTTIKTGVTLFMAMFLIMGLTATATAEDVTTTTNKDINWNRYVYIPCTGELVHFNGTLHVVTRVTTNDEGTHIMTHYNPKGITGVGLTNGTTFHAVGVTQKNFLYSDEKNTYNYVNNFKIISEGSEENYKVHMNSRLVMINGTITSYHDNLKITCK